MKTSSVQHLQLDKRDEVKYFSPMNRGIMIIKWAESSDPCLRRHWPSIGFSRILCNIDSSSQLESLEFIGTPVAVLMMWLLRVEEKRKSRSARNHLRNWVVDMTLRDEDVYKYHKDGFGPQ